jgi:branched-chain amino acid transport system substrate-binding protein
MRAVLPLAFLAGCLSDPVSPCTTDAECRDAFGFGSVCAEDGYCEQVALPDRCQTSPPDFATNPERYDNPIVIGSLYDADYDMAEMQSARLAITQANQNDGFDNRDFVLLECSYQETLDDGLDNVTATEALATELTGRLGINAYIGTLTSSSTQALYNTTEQLGGAFILSPAASSPALTNLDGITKTDANPGTLWRTVAPDSLQGRVAAEDMISRGVNKVAVVYQTGPYGEGLSQIFADFFAKSGGVVDDYPFSDDSGLASAVATVKGSDVQEVFVISSVTVDISTFLSAADSVGGYEDINIFLPDAAADVDTFNDTTAVDLLDQIRGTKPSVPSGRMYDTFKSAYLAAYQQDPNATVYMPLAYDAGWLMAYSAAWSLAESGELNPKSMGAGMRHVSSGTPIDLQPTSWNTVKSAFKTQTSIDVSGASGPLDYSPTDEETTAPIDIWVYRDGEIETIQTIEPDN